MGMLDYFKKAKEAKEKAEREKKEKERQERADKGEANYNQQQGKPGSDAWAALDE